MAHTLNEFASLDLSPSKSKQKPPMLVDCLDCGKIIGISGPKQFRLLQIDFLGDCCYYAALGAIVEFHPVGLF